MLSILEYNFTGNPLFRLSSLLIIKKPNRIFLTSAAADQQIQIVSLRESGTPGK